MRHIYGHDTLWRLASIGPERYGSFAIISDYDIGSFDLTKFWEGRSVSASELVEARLWVQDEDFEDSFDNPLGWHILSERFVALLREAGVTDDHELLPAPLYDENTKKHIPGYQILNPLVKVECMDTVRSKAIFHENLGTWQTQGLVTYLHRAKIPDHVKLFRVKESPTIIVLRGDVVAECYKRKMTGAWFMHLPTEDEEYIDNE
jgi:hypothetical protein